MEGLLIVKSFYIAKISMVLFISLACCCFMCSPQDYPECMNGFICYAYAPDGADSIKVDLIYEGTLLETETHPTIVGLPIKNIFLIIR